MQLKEINQEKAVLLYYSYSLTETTVTKDRITASLTALNEKCLNTASLILSVSESAEVINSETMQFLSQRFRESAMSALSLKNRNLCVALNSVRSFDLSTFTNFYVCDK